MADFITKTASIDRNGRTDGWLILPHDDRPALFLTHEELQGLSEWTQETYSPKNRD